MIDVRNLEFHYRGGEFSLQVPELSVVAGERVALIGPSGTGKTTLLNLMAGCLIPHAGSVSVDGTTLSSLPDARRRAYRICNIGLVFQEFELLEYLTVRDNILLPYRISHALHLDRDVRDRAADLAERVGIADKLGRTVDCLSQGERQRVAICRALLPNPPVLLADEPTGNLDPKNTDRVLAMLFDYVQAHSATLVSVTHEWHLLDRFSRTIDLGDTCPQMTQMGADREGE